MLFSGRKANRRNAVKCAQSEDLVDILKEEIEKQKERINSLTILYNRAQEDNDAKNMMLADITHEMRMPLSIILGIVQLMEKEQKAPQSDPGQKKAGKYLQQIKLNSCRLLRLIDNILDMSRIEAGQIKINTSSCNIVQLTEEIIQSASPFAVQGGLYLEFDTTEKEIITSIDTDKYEKILLNLLSNAIKFTGKDGKISVRISRITQKLRVSVKDNGPGIPREMQDVIFERFKQVGSHLTREGEGSGIGLSLVKSFVELHGGTVSLVSEVGKGSEFIIELPIIPPQPEEDADKVFQKNHNRILEKAKVEMADINTTAS